eukprot:TRINITY_DN28544_c0_g1_i1.p1 TRINITY_DN28544_c0_g1~~TRINITY_DN28544_c0_g1_i1.p1  ORF type:complete len:301 (+),score=66.67 TRINITY_DN28544_c0_g1_i1:187-1089(+)
MTDGRKLFVGRLPYSKSEADLWNLFQTIGPLTDITLLRDPRSNLKKGAAFVTYENPENATTALATFDNYVFPGSPRPIGVSLAKSGGDGDGGGGDGGGGADATVVANVGGGVGGNCGGCGGGYVNFGSGGYGVSPYLGGGGGCGPGGVNVVTGRFGGSGSPPPPPPPPPPLYGMASACGKPSMNHCASEGPPPHATGKRTFPQVSANDTSGGKTKLFVGQLPFSKAEEDLSNLFSVCGPLAEVTCFRDSSGQPKGAAFVTFLEADNAFQALQLDGYLFEGSSRPITVKYAEPSAKRPRFA